MSEVLAVIIGWVLGWFSRYLTNRRGTQLVVAYISQSPQIKISDRVREKLTISYRGAAVEKLVLTNLLLWNAGSRTIRDWDVTLVVQPENPSERFFFEVEVDDPQDRTTYQYGFSDGLPVMKIKRPYINSRRAYVQEEIGLSFISNGKFDVSAVGGGPDWGVKFVDVLGQTRNRLRAVGIAITVFVVSAGSATLFSLLWQRGVALSPVIAAIWGIPTILGVVGGLCWLAVASLLAARNASRYSVRLDET